LCPPYSCGLPGPAHPGVERVPLDAEHLGDLGRTPSLVHEHKCHAVIGIDRRQRAGQEIARFDHSCGIQRLIDYQREDASLAWFVKRVELNHARRELMQVSTPLVRDVLDAARGEEVLQGGAPVRIPLTPGQHLDPESLEAILNGLHSNVLGKVPPL
jgi:hypothetical protein